MANDDDKDSYGVHVPGMPRETRELLDAGEEAVRLASLAHLHGGSVDRLPPSEAMYVPDPAMFDDPTHAKAMRSRLMEHIIAFQEDLDENQEVGACLASFGQLIAIHVDDIGYHNPHLLMVYGRDEDDRRVELLQHVSQTQILLVAATVKPGRTAHRIGFHVDDD